MEEDDREGGRGRREREREQEREIANARLVHKRCDQSCGEKEELRSRARRGKGGVIDGNFDRGTSYFEA
eukprot:6204339-Pleurochrysis_carterae.AAC.2